VANDNGDDNNIGDDILETTDNDNDGDGDGDSDN
jgi:hypothetical protein